jgi:hypothetical protein
VLPALVAMFVRYINKELKVQHSSRALLVSLALAHVFGMATLSATASQSRDEVLMSALSKGVNDLTQPGDRVLLYDIQSQYQMEAYCYGLSGEVGNDLTDVLLRRETVDQFIRDNGVQFLVLSDPLGERALYQNTLLSELHAADPWVALGDTIMLGGLAFEKQFSNPAYVRSNSAASGAYADAGNHVPFPAGPDRDAPDPLWNSVYKVLGDETAVATARSEAMALLDGVVDPDIPVAMPTDTLAAHIQPDAATDVTTEPVSGEPAAVDPEQPQDLMDQPMNTMPARPDSL